MSKALYGPVSTKFCPENLRLYIILYTLKTLKKQHNPKSYVTLRDRGTI